MVRTDGRSSDYSPSLRPTEGDWNEVHIEMSEIVEDPQQANAPAIITTPPAADRAEGTAAMADGELDNDESIDAMLDNLGPSPPWMAPPLPAGFLDFLYKLGLNCV